MSHGTADQKKEQRKRYKLRHPEKVRECKRQQRMRKRKAKGIVPRSKGLSRVEWKALWKQIIDENDLNKCRSCGYDKCFAAIDFHHGYGDLISNKDRARYLLNQPPTRERIEKIKRCIPLCANCHRELHMNEKTMGIHKGGNGKAIEKGRQLSLLSLQVQS